MYVTWNLFFFIVVVSRFNCSPFIVGGFVLHGKHSPGSPFAPEAPSLPGFPAGPLGPGNPIVPSCPVLEIYKLI